MNWIIVNTKNVVYKIIIQTFNKYQCQMVF